MTRVRLRLARAAAAVAVLVGSSLFGWSGTASAHVLDGVGWWWRLQPGGTPVPLPNPNVPQNGLMVEGAPDDPATPEPDGASAIAALAFTLDEGQAKPILTLTVVKDRSQTGVAPIILACQAGSPWTAGGAQPWATHPKPACTNPVQGQLSADGGSVTFDLTPLQFENKLNVILVPGIDPNVPGANSSIFTLVFEGPTRDSIVTSAGAPPAPITPSTTPTPPGSTPGVAGSASPSFAPSAPVSAPTAALPPTQQGLTPSAPINTATQQTVGIDASDGEGNDTSRLIGMAVLIAGAALAFWSYRGGGPWAVATTAEETLGGLGRFARQREGVAPRLG